MILFCESKNGFHRRQFLVITYSSRRERYLVFKGHPCSFKFKSGAIPTANELRGRTTKQVAGYVMSLRACSSGG